MDSTHETWLERRRFRVVRQLTLAAFTLLAGLAVLDNPVPAAADDPPPIRVTTFASRNFTDVPRQYDVMQTLLELAPGAAVPSHRVNGRAIITVVSGTVTRLDDDGDSELFTAGQTLTETDEDHFDVDINLGSTPTRLLVSFLLQPGVEPLIFNPNQPPSAPGPKFLAVARTTVGTIPGQLTLSHAMIEVPTGWVGNLHTHDSWSIVTELSGGHVRNLVNGVSQNGATFVHGPLDLHEGQNTGPTVMAMFASVGPTGAPTMRLVGASAPPLPAIRPPATGDGGLAVLR